MTPENERRELNKQLSESVGILMERTAFLVESSKQTNEHLERLNGHILDHALKIEKARELATFAGRHSQNNRTIICILGSGVLVVALGIVYVMLGHLGLR